MEKALKQDPTLAEAHRELCKLAFAERDLKRAAEHAKGLKELVPDDPEASLMLAACLDAGGDPVAALKEISAATGQVGAASKTFTAAGDLHLKQRSFEKAEAAYRQAVELDPEDGVPRVGLAASLRAQGKLEEAQQQLDVVLKDEPEHVLATVELAEVQVARREVAAAVKTLEQLTRRELELYGSRARLAELLVRTRRPDAGVAAALQVLKERPRHIESHLVLAQTFLSRGLHTMALEHCDRVLGIDRGNAPARCVRARVYLAKRQHDDSVRELRMALESAPDHFAARMLLGQAYLAADQLEQAKECYETVAKLYPKSPRPHIQLGSIQVRKGLPEAALLHYEEARRRAPDSPVAANNIATLLLDLGTDLDRAYQLASDLKKRFPGFPAASDTYGWACYKRGEYQKAVDSLSYAARRMPRRPDVRYHYGMALYKAGEVKEAREELAAALKLSETFPGAAEAKAVLVGAPAPRHAAAKGVGGRTVVPEPDQPKTTSTETAERAAAETAVAADGKDRPTAERVAKAEPPPQPGPAGPAKAVETVAQVDPRPEPEVSVPDRASSTSGDPLDAPVAEDRSADSSDQPGKQAAPTVDAAEVEPSRQPETAAEAKTPEVETQTDRQTKRETPVSGPARSTSSAPAASPAPATVGERRVPAPDQPVEQETPGEREPKPTNETSKQPPALPAETPRASYPSQALLKHTPRGERNDNPYARGLSILLEPGGTPIEYDEIMGLTGLAFIMQAQNGQPLVDGAVNVGQWPLASWGFLQRLGFLGKSLGWTIGRVDRDSDAYQADPSKHYRERFELSVKESIANGQPLLAVQKGCFVVRGYDDGDPPLLGNWSDTEDTGDIRIQAHPSILIRFEARRPPMRRSDIDRESLRYAVALSRDAGSSERFTGQRSFELWIKALRDTEHLGEARWHTDLVRHLRINRSSAVAYLSAMSKRHPDKVAQHLTAAAGQYRRELALLLTADTSKTALVVRPAGRQELAELVKRLAKAENAAIAAIERALAAGLGLDSSAE